MLFAPIYLLVAVVGIWISIARRKRYPKAMMLAIIGFSCLLLYNFLMVVVLPIWVFLYTGGDAQAMEVLTQSPRVKQLDVYADIAKSILYLCAFAALGSAVFTDRGNVAVESSASSWS